MIDGVKIVCNGVTPADWITAPGLDFGLYISETTGEIVGKYKEAEKNGLRFRIAQNSGVCSVLGSLHRFHNAGGLNSDLFGFEDLCATIDTLQIQYKINPATAAIQRLEIGINIPLNYSPEIIIKSTICYKGRPAAEMIEPHHRRKIGRIWELSAYSVKLYDKGNNILRFELAYYHTGEIAAAGVRCLQDLTTPANYARLYSQLLAALKGFIFYDFKYKPAELTPAARRDWLQYCNPYYWQSLSKHARTKAIRRYWEKVAKYGAINWRDFLVKKATQIYYDLTQCKPQKRLPFPGFAIPIQAQKTATFSELGLLTEKVATTNGRGYLLKEAQTAGRPAVLTARQNPARFCVCCGRDISGQKSNSRFCSERLFGPIARQCRNKDSNRRLTLKRQIERAKQRNCKIAVTYSENGALYIETLNPAELGKDRATLDRVREIRIIAPPPGPPQPPQDAPAAGAVSQSGPPSAPPPPPGATGNNSQ